MSLKAAIIKFLAPYQYPQAIFGRECRQAIGRPAGRIMILDCPCGNGEVSYHLSKIPGAAVRGVDLDPASIARAAKNFKRNNLVFEAADIFTRLSTNETYDIICVVNSLFLLPDHERLFALLHARLSDKSPKLLVITPNPGSVNFKNFEARNPAVNKTVLNRAQIGAKAREMGFNLTGSKEIVYASYYGRSELSFFLYLPPFIFLR